MMENQCPHTDKQKGNFSKSIAGSLEYALWKLEILNHCDVYLDRRAVAALFDLKEEMDYFLLGLDLTSTDKRKKYLNNIKR